LTFSGEHLTNVPLPTLPQWPLIEPFELNFSKHCSSAAVPPGSGADYESVGPRGNLTVTPDVLALQGQRGTDSVEAVTVVAARVSVFLEHVDRTLSVVSRAVLGEVALVGGFPTDDSSLPEHAVVAAGPRGALSFRR
jgi:hypothetical protein